MCTGNGFTVAVVAAEAALRQPAALVTWTVGLLEVVTLILAVVSPVDHKYVVPALDVRVTLPPAQNVSGPPAVMVGVAGSALTVTVVAAEAALRQPAALVTWTVGLLEVVTLILAVVSPVDHK